MKVKKAKVHKVGLTYRQMMLVRNAANRTCKRMSENLMFSKEWETADEVEKTKRDIAALDRAVRKMTDVLTDAVMRGDK